MKKILCLFLSIIMCVSLVACGNDRVTEATTEVTTEAFDPVENAKEKLAKAYETCCDGVDIKYASLGYDKMSLTIDTKPNDTYYRYEDDAVTAIVAINVFLELPSSIIEKMTSTRALDGVQTQDCGDYTVTWNYHPDNGLKVIYEVNL